METRNRAPANNRFTVTRTNRKVFIGLNLVLLPLVPVTISIGVSIGYYKGEGPVAGWQSLLYVFGGVIVGVLLLNLLFSGYKIAFDDETLIYRHFFRKRSIRFSDIESARYEFGYKSYWDQWRPIKRFVIYPKSYPKDAPLVINLSPLPPIDKLVTKLKSLNKLVEDENHPYPIPI